MFYSWLHNGVYLCEVIHPDLFSVQLWLCSYTNSSDPKRLLRNEKRWLSLPGNVSQSCISRRGAPVGFSQVIPSTFPSALIGWFTCASVILCRSIVGRCVCSVFYSKSPWEARAFAAGVVRKISWPVLMFCRVSWGQAGLIPCFLSRVCYPTHGSAFPLLLLERFFFIFFLERVCGAVPAQIEICQCPLLSFLTPTGVALFCFNFFFFLQQPAYGLLEARRQAEPKLLAQAALFAHAWRW